MCVTSPEGQVIAEHSLDSRGPSTQCPVYARKVVVGTLKNSSGLDKVIPYVVRSSL